MDARYGWAGVVFILIFGAVIYFFTINSPKEVLPALEEVQPSSSSTTMDMKLTSTAFTDGSSVPPIYTCDGAGTSPALSFVDVPEVAVSLVLIMDDPDVPKQLKPDGVFDHWVLFNIPPEATGIPEGGTAGTPGANGRGESAYTGPCPPPQYEPSTHRYIFKLYALDTTLELQEGASKAEVLAVLQGHILAEAELTGTYSRK